LNGGNMADNPKSPLGHIQSVRVKFLKTGEYQELTFKDKSRCLFFMDTIDTDKEKVQLRLDFGDSCARGEPVLDADFYKNGKKVKRLIILNAKPMVCVLTHGSMVLWKNLSKFISPGF
ncbi:TPA: hypothetical protein ACGU4V_004655, partial [Vibrio vulnificus]